MFIEKSKATLYLDYPVRKDSGILMFNALPLRMKGLIARWVINIRRKFKKNFREIVLAVRPFCAQIVYDNHKTAPELQITNDL